MKIIKVTVIFMAAVLSVNVLALVNVPGTQVSITPPKELKPATQFPGYIDEDYGTSIMFSEIPGPVNEVLKGFDANNPASKGLNFTGRENIKLNGQDAILITATQVAYDIEFSKLILVFGDDKKSVVVVASYATQLADKLSGSLKKAILSVVWNKDHVSDFLSGLNFKVKESKSLKFATKINNSIILSENGVIPFKSFDDPNVVVVPSVDRVLDIKDQASDALNQLMRVSSLSKIEVVSQKEIIVNGIKGQKITASAASNYNAEGKLFVYFVVLYPKETCYIFKATVKLKEKDLYEQEFNYVLNSFSLD